MLGSCGLFQKLMPEKKLAKLFCFRHRAEQEFYAKAKPDYEGCEECSWVDITMHQQVAVTTFSRYTCGQNFTSQVG
jgi:hypothetical protein